MKKEALLALILAATPVSAEPREAFIFASLDDSDAVDQIDVNCTWRNTATLYQALRDLGLKKNQIAIFYNTGTAEREDMNITLKNELQTKPLHKGNYKTLDDYFVKKAKNLKKDDDVILVLMTHGNGDNYLYPSFDKKISSAKINALVKKTNARAIVYYHACYTETLLPAMPAPNAAFVAATKKEDVLWSDRNYCSATDYFSAFTKQEADRDRDRKVTLEEAAAYTREKWNKYHAGFLAHYLEKHYQLPRGASEEQYTELMSVSPIIKRGPSVPKEWTIGQAGF